MFRKLKWLIHPISILIIAQICWGLLMFVWIRWYILRGQEIDSLASKLPTPKPLSGQWIILAQGCILMAFILLGLYMIFVSQRKMSRLTKMQDAILSSVTHELKTPLASIRMYTETQLLRSLTEDDRKKFLQRTLNESERLQKLIDTVLVSARLESRQFDPFHEQVDLKQVLQICFQKVKERIGDSRNFNLSFLGESNILPLFILGNDHHLSMLFDNIFNNAIKYTSENGDIKCVVSLKKDLIFISVIDNGLGIEHKNIKKIFKKFYRIQDSPSSRSVSGSGLGLSVCKAIVAEHSGYIFAQSQGINKGTSIHVELKRFHPYC